MQVARVAYIIDTMDTRPCPCGQGQFLLQTEEHDTYGGVGVKTVLECEACNQGYRWRWIGLKEFLIRSEDDHRLAQEKDSLWAFRQSIEARAQERYADRWIAHVEQLPTNAAKNRTLNPDPRSRPSDQTFKKRFQSHRRDEALKTLQVDTLDHALRTLGIEDAELAADLKEFAERTATYRDLEDSTYKIEIPYWQG